MNIQTVNVSPIAPHFLLRSRIEQRIIVGAALAFAAPLLYPVALATYAAATSHTPMPEGMLVHVAATFGLAAAVLGGIGWWLGTRAANLVALLRARRALDREGKL